MEVQPHQGYPGSPIFPSLQNKAPHRGPAGAFFSCDVLTAFMSSLVGILCEGRTEATAWARLCP